MAPVHISLLACFLPVITSVQFTLRWHGEFRFSITTKAIFLTSETENEKVKTVIVIWVLTESYQMAFYQVQQKFSP